MMECAIASTASTATGYFQNQTTTSCAISGARRPRAVLLDVSNIEPIRKRACTVKAEKLISMQQKSELPGAMLELAVLPGGPAVVNLLETLL